MPLHIGIVACSAEGAALCYRTICLEGAELLGQHNHPEVSMHTYSLAQYMNRVYENDWPGVAELMLSSAEKLAIDAGVDSARKGAHLVRHTLATDLLRQNFSLDEIGELLRHQSPNTTALYAKVDLTALRTLALPWPGGAR